jgi:hypothetical protein
MTPTEDIEFAIKEAQLDYEAGHKTKNHVARINDCTLAVLIDIAKEVLEQRNG